MDTVKVCVTWQCIVRVECVNIYIRLSIQNALNNLILFLKSTTMQDRDNNNNDEIVFTIVVLVSPLPLQVYRVAQK